MMKPTPKMDEEVAARIGLKLVPPFSLKGRPHYIHENHKFRSISRDRYGKCPSGR